MVQSTATLVRAGAKSLFLEYCSNSSVHGVSYIGSPKRTWCEKIWWIVAFTLSVGSCALLIHQIYQKWDQNPVIVSLNEKYTPIWQIPFPAVTICPESKGLPAELNFTQEYDEFINLTSEERITYNRSDSLLAMIQLCKQIFREKFLFEAPIPQICNSTVINDMSFFLYDTMYSCSVRRKDMKCNTIFTKSMTEEGFCVTFNGLSANELLRTEVLQTDIPYLGESHKAPRWTIANGYSPNASLSSYPFRTHLPEYAAGLQVNLKSNFRQLDHLCRGPADGFKILLHSPADYPQISNRFIRVPMNQDVIVAVNPNMITTTSSLRDYAPERRQCFFDHERYLQFFRVYTQNNCELECLANFTLHHCGCVKITMLRTNQTAVCRGDQVPCVQQAETLLLVEEVRKQQPQNWRTKCNCLPACTSVQYGAEINRADTDWVPWAQALKVSSDEIKGTHIGRLGIYFKYGQFMSSKRSELHGLTDFLANCGGVLGLCMGMSLLSLVELLYYCSVRPVVLWRRYGRMV